MGFIKEIIIPPKNMNEWIRFENDYAIVGMTALAKRELGIITNIEIHTTGKILTENQVFGTITTEKYLCKLIMPPRTRLLKRMLSTMKNLITWMKISIRMNGS